MSVLVIEDLRANVGDREILRGIDLEVASGEVHAVMGPNGSGKSTLSHVLMGRPGYDVTGGSVTLDGEDLLALPTWRRAQLGLFLAMQYPTEVPGVSLVDALSESFAAAGRDRDEVPALLLAEAGAQPSIVTRLGPAIAVECPHRCGAHINGAEWTLAERGGELFLSTTGPRAHQVIEAATGLHGTITEGGCGCGRTGQRVSIPEGEGNP